MTYRKIVAFQRAAEVLRDSSSRSRSRNPAGTDDQFFSWADACYSHAVVNDVVLESHLFRWPDGSHTKIAGDALECMHDEATLRGLTLDQLWEEMLREADEATKRDLEMN